MKSNSPEVIVGFMIGLVICATAVAALLEFTAKRRKDPSLRVWGCLGSFIFIYGVPAVLLGVFAAYCFTAFVLVPYFPASISDCDLRDRACVARIDRAAHEAALKVGLAAIELLALAYIGFAAWWRTRSKVLLTAAQKQALKWHFDEETGEYHRVLNRRGGKVLYQAETDAQRSLEREQRAFRRKVSGWTFVLGAALTPLFFWLAKINSASSAVWVLGFLCGAAGLGCFGSLGSWLGAAEMELGDTVGPAPVRPRGKEEVEKQKAYGDAGAASVDDIHAALSGTIPAISHPQATPSGPIYDE